MKNKFFILILMFISLIACSSDDGPKEDNEQQLPVTVANLEGTWLAVEYRDHSGSEFGPYQSLNEGYTYQLRNDFTIISNDFSSNTTCEGTYLVEENELKFNFECA